MDPGQFTPVLWIVYARPQLTSHIITFISSRRVSILTLLWDWRSGIRDSFHRTADADDENHDNVNDDHLWDDGRRSQNLKRRTKSISDWASFTSSSKSTSKVSK